MNYLNWLSYKKRLILTLVAVMLTIVGCSGLRPYSKFEISLPSMHSWSDVTKIAVLDFAVPLGDSRAGTYLSKYLSTKLSEKSAYELASVFQTRSILKTLHILPSRFRELAIIKKVGEQLEVDALIFGDIPNLTIIKKVENKIVKRKVGEEVKEYIWIDSNGITRTSQQLIPVYKDVLQRTIHRTVICEIEARVVKIQNNELLWQNKINDEQYYYAFEEGEERTGNWSSDETLLVYSLQTAGIKLIKSLLPKKVKKIRFFAVPTDKSDYAEVIKQGNLVAQKEHWNEAGRLWLKALQMNSKRPEARANLGIMREKAGEHQQALNDYKYAGSLLGERWEQYYKDVQSYLSHFVRTLQYPKSSK